MEGPSGTRAQIEAMFVLSAYGWAMLNVQAFERLLATLSLALETDPWRKRPFKSHDHMRRYMEQLLSRCLHRFHKASASELRNMLPPGLDPELEG